MDFIVVFPQFKKLGLNITSYTILSMIYNYSKDNINVFRCSFEYISEFLGISKRNCINIINDLCNNGYILKNRIKTAFNVVYNTYKINFDNDKIKDVLSSEKISLPSEKISLPSEKISLPSEKISPNSNIISNNIKKKDDDLSSSSKEKVEDDDDFPELWIILKYFEVNCQYGYNPVKIKEIYNALYDNDFRDSNNRVIKNWKLYFKKCLKLETDKMIFADFGNESMDLKEFNKRYGISYESD